MKKIISLVLVLVLALSAIGGTLAYFTDTDKETNTFTIGDVKIDLLEEFDEENAQLIPGKIIDKIVTVKNVGTNDAYVRVHVGIPTALVDQNGNSFNDMLHVNMKKASFQGKEWIWTPNYVENGAGWINNGRDNNVIYNTEINGEPYTVWVITYRTVLSSNQETATSAICQAYMDQYVDTVENEDGTVKEYVKKAFTDKQNGTWDGTWMKWPADKKIDVLVFAEGVQSEGFDNAYAAFDAAFGKVGTYNPWAPKA